MKLRRILIAAIFISATQMCSGQTNLLDSCGMNSNPLLNKYEISVLDSLFFTRKKPITGGFNFSGKRVAFYSCTKNSNTKGDGLLSKKDFFSLCRPDFKGHAGRGFITFTESEKAESKGYDVVIIIDCPYSAIDKAALIQKLQQIKYDE
ncbi:MAG: hypothetical protein IPP93_17385 [Chitinophagaceae bacterium]|nr:hypothetical protein [Chitinophagaceae bacterium]